MKKSGCIFKVLIIAFLVVFTVLALLFTLYMFDKADVKDFLTDDFLLYLNVKSLKDVYDRLIDLKAAEVILSTDQFDSLYKNLLAFKSSELVRNKFVSNLLNIEADMALYLQNSNQFLPVFIFDMKIKSLITRFLPMSLNFFQSDSIKINKIKEKKYVIYEIVVQNSGNFYFGFFKNLVFFSNQKQSLVKIFSNYFEKKANIKDLNLKRLDQTLPKKGFARAYFSSDQINKLCEFNYPDIYNILKDFLFEKMGILSFDVSNDFLYFGSNTPFTTNNDQLKKFLDYTPLNLQVTKYLPQNTNIYFSTNFKSFKEFYTLFHSYQKQDFKDQVDKINRLSKNLFNLNIDDLLFSWTGRELGFLTTDVSQDVIVYVKFKDRKKFDFVLNRLASSIIFDKSEDLLFDNVRLNKLTNPKIIRMIFESMIKGFDSPYYLIIDDFIFFSLNPENLSSLYKKYELKETLTFDPEYKKVTQDIAKRANIFLYYNITHSTPLLLNTNNIFNKILNLYERGVLTVNLNKDQFKINLSSFGENKLKTKLFPGFPKNIKNGIASDILCENITGSPVNELIYLTQNNNLVVADINNRLLSGFPIPMDKKSHVIIETGNKKTYYLTLVTPEGEFHKYDLKTNTVYPYPVLYKELKGSFPPVYSHDQYIVFSRSERKLYFINAADAKKTEYPYNFKTPLLRSPEIKYNYFAFYPKSFSGEVYLCDSEGTVQAGWPQLSGGISFSKPYMERLDANEIHVVFLTQAGRLSVWNKKGEYLPQFPLKLDGVFFADPVIGELDRNKKNKEIAVISKEGFVSVISITGAKLVSRQIENISGKDFKLMLFDVDNDGTEEIFIYGGSNYITALDQGLDLLPGFPVKGTKQPQFCDLNFDGVYEMVTAGIDNKIYTYSIYK